MARLIHICGAARTGTTILGLALGQSRQVFYGGELHALFRPFRTTHFDPLCNCGAQPCAVWEGLGPLTATDYVIRMTERLGVDTIVDSSGDLPWFFDQHAWARGCGYSLVDILTWKHPMELAHSQWKRGRPIENALRTFNNHYGRILQIGVPFLAVELSVLTGSPTRVMKQICQLCEIGYTEEMVSLPDPGHFLFGSAGVRARMSEVDFALGDDSVKPVYEPEFIDDYDKSLAAFGSAIGIKDIIERLKRHDVMAATKVVGSHASEIGLVKPMWYYKQRSYRQFRRYFPKPFRQ